MLSFNEGTIEESNLFEIKIILPLPSAKALSSFDVSECVVLILTPECELVFDNSE